MNNIKWILGIITACLLAAYFFIIKPLNDVSKIDTNPSIEKSEVQVKKTYDDAGNLKADAEIVNGLQHGVAHNYYKDGSIHSVIYYNKGKKVGVSTWFYQDGNPYRETPYKNGLIDGIQKKYYKNGKLMAEIPYKENQVQPGTKEYSETGRIIETELKLDVVTKKAQNRHIPILISVSGKDLNKITDYEAFYFENESKTKLASEKIADAIHFGILNNSIAAYKVEVIIWLGCKTKMNNKKIIEKKIVIELPIK